MSRDNHVYVSPETWDRIFKKNKKCHECNDYLSIIFDGEWCCAVKKYIKDGTPDSECPLNKS
jgi:hypothetical protein